MLLAPAEISMSNTLPRRIVIVDSSSFLHRFYHGYPPRQGQVDGQFVESAALYGYMYYMGTLQNEIEFEGIVHCLDNPEGSAYRKELYAPYKSNRSDKSEDLIYQEAMLAPLLNSLGHRVLQVPGVEADDLVGSLARKLADQGDEVLVLTGDKDLMQLVDDGRILLADFKDQGPGRPKQHVFLESQQVVEKCGVRPDQVADFLALVGDASDNIPGVFKVGPKTAATWLNKYGSLANLMTHASEIKGKAGENLRTALPELPIFRRLTGCLDLPVEVPPPGQLNTDWARDLVAWPERWSDATLPHPAPAMEEDTAPRSVKRACP